MRTQLGQYLFVDFEGHADDQAAAQALHLIKNEHVLQTPGLLPRISGGRLGSESRMRKYDTGGICTYEGGLLILRKMSGWLSG